MMRARARGWILVAAVAASACGGDGESYEITISPVEVTRTPPDSFTLQVVTRFANTPPIYLTTVEVAAEPTAIVSSVSSSKVEFDADATQTSFDPGPPPSYSFKPRDSAEGYSVQRLELNCLTTGETTLSFDATWRGGEPDDPHPTVVTRHGQVQVICN